MTLGQLLRSCQAVCVCGRDRMRRNVKPSECCDLQVTEGGKHVKYNGRLKSDDTIYIWCWQEFSPRAASGPYPTGLT